MKKVGFIIHGKLQSNTALQGEVAEHFLNNNVEIHYTEFAHHAIQLAQNLCAKNFEYVIATGGDGTLNEVINGVMLSGKNQVVNVGVLPFGSGNDFVKTVPVPASISSLANCIKNDCCKKIDLLHCRFTAPDGRPAERYSNNITDVGMGGEIAEQLSRSKKWLGATLTYQYFIIKTLLTYKKKEITVIADDFNYTGEIMNFCVCNGKYFGSGLGVAPGAIADDGKINFVCIGKVGLWDYLQNFSLIKKCMPITHPEVFYHSCTRVCIDGTNERLPIDLDGEFAGYSPIEVTILPKAINLISPP